MVREQFVGWEEYDGFLSFLYRLGIPYVQLEQEWRNPGFWHGQERDLRKRGYEPARLRKAAYVHPITGKHIIIEEYVRWWSDNSDGCTYVIEIIRYRAGERPHLLDSWREYCQEYNKAWA